MSTQPYKYRSKQDKAQLEMLGVFLFGYSPAYSFRAFKCLTCQDSIPNPIADDGTLYAARKAGLTEATIGVQLNNLEEWCIDLMCVDCRTRGLAKLAEMKQREATPQHQSVTAQGTPN